MTKQHLFKWLQQHQRRLLFGLFLFMPLLTLLIVGVREPDSESTNPAPTMAPSATGAIAPLPSVPLSTPQPSVTTPPPAKPAPQKTPTAKVGVKNPTYTGQQAVINQRAKEAFTSLAASVDAAVEMRVAIAVNASTLTVGTSSEGLITSLQGKSLGQLAAQTTYAVTHDGGGLRLGASALPDTVVLDPGPGGLFYLGDRSYRGRLVLIARPDGTLMAVNHVSLRKYLHSVVASEVSSSWSIEALKAQAVAARSYALTYHFKPVSSLYDLGNDEYYQVYSGIAREAESTNKAVDLTAGEYVSYKGGVVESLYAASDDIVAEAFQGHGMSQLGALNLAEQGYTYAQILANYYPSTKVGRIEIDHE